MVLHHTLVLHILFSDPGSLPDCVIWRNLGSRLELPVQESMLRRHNCLRTKRDGQELCTQLELRVCICNLPVQQV